MRGALAIALAAVASLALAQERAVVAKDGEVVRVSSSEPNLIEAAAGKVSAFVFTAGAFTETVDHDAGVVYIRPLAEGPRSGFVEVIDDKGGRSRFSLVLVPDPGWPAQRVVIGEAASKADHEAAPKVAKLPSAHVAGVKALVRRLAKGEGEALEERASTHGDFNIVPVARVLAQGLIGELLRVENATEGWIRVDESALARDPGTVAVAVPDPDLGPGAAAKAYRVRSATEAGPR